MIYLTWVTPEEPLTGTDTFPVEEEVLGIKIHHTEGGFPSAHVVIAETDKTPAPLPTHATLFYKKNGGTKVLFKGRLIVPPLKQKDRALTFELTAEPEDALDLLTLDQRPLKTLPSFDPLFVNPEHENDLDEILEGYTKLPHWNREGDFCFSDILKGSKTIELHDHFDQKSLKTTMIRKPIDAVSVDIKAEWIQEFTGLLNLSSCIMNALSDRMISTLTPHYVRKHWWKAGHTLPQTAYQIAQAELIPFDPFMGGVESRFPSLSAPFHIGDRYPVHLPRFWFVPHLVMCFHYRQKRSETVRFTLSSPFTPHGKTPSLKKLHFTLQNIRKDVKTPVWQGETAYEATDCIQQDGKHYECQISHRSSPRFEEDTEYWCRIFKDQSPLGNQAASSYFLTPRGEESIRHAAERAHAHLTASARVIEVTFEVPFEQVEDIDCDTSVSITDARLKGGTIRGKVVAYTFLFKHGVAVAKIRLLTTPPMGPASSISLANVWCKTPSGILLGSPKSKTPILGIKDPHLLEGEDIFKQLKKVNGPDEQNALINGKAFSSLKEAEASLKNHPTHLSIELFPLNQQKRLHHDIQLTAGY